MIKKIMPAIIIAAILWFFMFSPWTKDYLNFWVGMSVSAGILSLMGLYIQRKNLKELFDFKLSHIYIGIASAIALYLIFYIGNYISKIIFPFAPTEVNNIYNNKVQANYIIISLLLLFWIGPAEEIFWRGFVQYNFLKKYSALTSLITSSIIYSLVHIWSFNFMLVMAALVCGLFWGYLFNRYRSIIPVLVSHSIWDFLIFILIPIS